MKTWLGLVDTGAVGDEIAPVDMLGPVSFTMRPMLPTDRQANSMLALQLVNAPTPLMSPETAMEDLLQLADPLGEMDRIWVNKAMNDPTVAAPAVADALRRSGIKPPPPPILGPDGSPLPPSGGPTGPVGPGGPGPGIPANMAGGMPPNPSELLGMAQPPRPGVMPHGGGVPGGSFPGMPGGPHKTA